MAHVHSTKNHGKAFGIGIGLNTIFVGVELFYGFQINSTALLADAGHNASDVLSLVLAWVALAIVHKRPSEKYTYGLRKSTVMASMINGALIIAAACLIAWEAIQKFQNPAPVPGTVVMVVATVGLLINAVTAWLFYKDQKSDLNIKGAFMHMAADAGVSLGVLIGGVAIRYTSANWIDPVLGLLIVVVICYSAWGLLRDSLALAMDAVPQNIDIQKVKAFLNDIDGVDEVHDLHIWAMSTTEVALTAHLVVPRHTSDGFIYKIREELHEKFGISHTTIQIEKEHGDEAYRPYQTSS